MNVACGFAGAPATSFGCITEPYVTHGPDRFTVRFVSLLGGTTRRFPVHFFGSSHASAMSIYMTDTPPRTFSWLSVFQPRRLLSVLALDFFLGRARKYPYAQYPGYCEISFLRSQLLWSPFLFLFKSNHCLGSHLLLAPSPPHRGLPIASRQGATLQ